MPLPSQAKEIAKPGGENASAPELSIIAPLYNEAATVAPLVVALRAALVPLGRAFEIVLVDDGSTDQTAARLAEFAGDPNVRVLRLARNYGQSTAIQAGFDASLGEIVITIDGDLQNDPADIPAMLRHLEETGADLVSGWRRARKDGPARVLASRIANRLISALTNVRLHDFGCSLKVYRRSRLRHVRIYGELHRFLPAVMAEVGGKVVEFEVSHNPRRFGRSKYGFDRTLRVLLDLLLIKFLHRYLHRPLHFFGGIGVGAFGIGFVIGLYLTVLKFGFGAEIGGRPLLMLAVFLMLSGVFFITQGLIGEILIRVLYEPQGRRQYVTLDDEDGSPDASAGRGP
ncbi:MAG: glycosyltransferase family 2 protein [Alphaproteobacteria bacterium]